MSTSTTNTASRGGPDVAFAHDVPSEDRETIATLLGDCATALGSSHASVRPLVGGANNRNYVADCGERRVVVRIANLDADRMAVDRASAAQAQRDAARAGLGPELLTVRLPEGHAVSEFLSGATLREEALAQPPILEAIASSLKRLHASSTTARRFDPFADIRKWADLTRADGTETPDDLPAMLEACAAIEAAIDAAALPLVFCHNDTVPQNFLYDDGVARLVDWDYAGLGWAAFELASVCATAGLDAQQRDMLLTAYSNGATPAQRATLDVLGLVAAVREVTWALMVTPILDGTTTLLDGWSYQQYLAANLDRARALRTTLPLADLLDLVASEKARAW